MSRPLTLAEIYQECTIALREREHAIDERCSFLLAIGLGDSDAVASLKETARRARLAGSDIRHLAALAETELEQLRFECSRLRARATSEREEADVDSS